MINLVHESLSLRHLTPDKIEWKCLRCQQHVTLNVEFGKIPVDDVDMIASMEDAAYRDHACPKVLDA